MSEDRYLIADPDMPESNAWDHYVGTDHGEQLLPTRFIFDREDEEILRAEALYKGEWIRLTWDDVEDLEDSLVTANPQALDNPASYGLATSDEVPDWAAPSGPRP
jgi:hypothetical protein